MEGNVGVLMGVGRGKGALLSEDQASGFRYWGSRNARLALEQACYYLAVAQNPYCQAFDLRGGEIVALNVESDGIVYLISAENMPKYYAGRSDFSAEASLPFAKPIELVARKAGRWFLVSERQLTGTYRLRRGVEATSGQLHMQPVKRSSRL